MFFKGFFQLNKVPSEVTSAGQGWLGNHSAGP